MNFSMMTVSFPIDEETYNEIKALCEESRIGDGVYYQTVLNLPVARDYTALGFFVLVYDDEAEKLVGVASAIDLMGLNTYEWSMLVAPMYRQIGIGGALLNVLRDGLEARGAEGELALAVQGETFGRAYLESRNYSYSFSEATLEAKAEEIRLRENLIMRPFQVMDTESLVAIFSEAFGDLREESLELIQFNSTTEGLQLWVADMDGKVVGTVTSRKEGDSQWVTALAVHPNMEGQGIGTALLNWVKHIAFQGGEKMVMLEVEIENERALSLYKRAGFLKSMQIDYFVYGGR
ncbi:GNAT family N-acetyltransferase [Lysinibacillus sp. 54212]|uniref:GNAT family N-acetyltransferase n=1 Tax=Lysinibacillus sp. 54212 TaxID=3119829 RepID=UPI002FC72AA9